MKIKLHIPWICAITNQHSQEHIIKFQIALLKYRMVFGMVGL